MSLFYSLNMCIHLFETLYWHVKLKRRMLWPFQSDHVLSAWCGKITFSLAITNRITDIEHMSTCLSHKFYNFQQKCIKYLKNCCLGWKCDQSVTSHLHMVLCLRMCGIFFSFPADAFMVWCIDQGQLYLYLHEPCFGLYAYTLFWFKIKMETD